MIHNIHYRNADNINSYTSIISPCIFSQLSFLYIHHIVMQDNIINPQSLQHSLSIVSRLKEKCNYLNLLKPYYFHTDRKITLAE